jgi:hypothetical protein
MPMNSSQLAALVERARKTPPPVVSPPSQPAQPRPAKAATQAPAPPPLPAPVPEPNHPTPPDTETAAPDDDFPIGWQLRKESWNFHRRFYRVLRRPMHRGEYSYLLHQIRGGHAEHLGENCWRVTLPDRRRTLMICATSWRLITILPKDWQPTARKQECAEDA